MGFPGSELLRADQGVDEVAEQQHGHDATENEIEAHHRLSKPVAQEHVAQADGEERRSQGEHQDIEHEVSFPREGRGFV